MGNRMTENMKRSTPFTCDAWTEVIAPSAKEILAAAVQAEAQHMDGPAGGSAG